MVYLYMFAMRMSWIERKRLDALFVLSEVYKTLHTGYSWHTSNVPSPEAHVPEEHKPCQGKEINILGPFHMCR